MKPIVIVDPYQIYYHGLSAIFPDHLEIRFFDTFDRCPREHVQLLILGFCPDHLESCFGIAKKSKSPLLALLDNGCRPFFKEIITEAHPNSFLHRSAPRSIVVRAVEATMNGEKFVDNKILPWFIDVFSDEATKYNLTTQEMAVSRFVLQGLSNQEIAEQLQLALPTVKFHLKNIFRKTGAQNRAQLISLFSAYFIHKV